MSSNFKQTEHIIPELKLFWRILMETMKLFCDSKINKHELFLFFYFPILDFH